MSMIMASLIKQKVILKDGIHHPKIKSREKNSNQDKEQTSSTSTNQGEHGISSTTENLTTERSRDIQARQQTT